MGNILDRILKRYNLVKKLWLIRSNHKVFIPEEQILIFSDPRGGSTWLAELINTIEHTTIVWEPLSISGVKPVQKLGFGWRQYIPEGEQWIEAKLVFDQILSGCIKNEWTLLKTDVKKFNNAHKLIIKFCRGNMLLPWLVNQYSFKYKPVYLIRHPFAVVSSQLKQGGWNYSFAKFEIPKIPYNELYQEHYNFMSSLETKEELMTAMWCLTNKIALESELRHKYLTVFYEDLVLAPQSVITEIFNDWSITIPMGIDLKFRNASSTTLIGTDVKSIQKQLSLWKHSFSNCQLNKMTNVLKHFDVKIYNARSFLPQK